MHAYTEYCCGRLPLTLTDDIFSAFNIVKALEYINIIISTIVIILLIQGGNVKPPNPSLQGLDSTAAQHRVRDHLPAVSTSYCTSDNVDAFSQETASFLSGQQRTV